MVLGRFGWFHVLVPTVRKKVLSLHSLHGLRFGVNLNKVYLPGKNKNKLLEYFQTGT